MTLQTIDWVIIAVYLVGCMAAGIWMRRYVRGVDDFAVAAREMDVHLGVASLAATEVGIVTIMYTAQMGFTNGLAGATTGLVTALAMLIVGITGFVIVPLRKAGVITIPELFEKRFGKRVRWLAGLVIILGGVLNMGVFLRAGGDFLMHITGMDSAASFQVHLGGASINFGYLELLMTGLLAIVLVYTVLGGMLSVLITDYLQFLVMGMGIVVTSLLVLHTVGWTDLLKDLRTAHEAGETYEAAPLAEGQLAAARQPLAEKSVLVGTTRDGEPEALTMNAPFDPFASQGMGWAWVLWQTIMAFAVVTTWQTTIARVLAARDANTAKKVYRGTWFYFVGRWCLPGLWGAAAFVYFTQHGGLPAGVTSETAMPRFLGLVLSPATGVGITGLLGLMIAAMLAAEMSTDSGYLLTWATVIYNDLIMPCLRRPLSERARLLIVRLLVLAIGAFLVFWGLWYKPPGSMWEYLSVTGNIYLASLFALLVGALYWPAANHWGAMAAIVLGATGPLVFLAVNGYAGSEVIPAAVSGLAAFGLAFSGMIVGSLLGAAAGVNASSVGDSP